jgi:hypothetical protein
MNQSIKNITLADLQEQRNLLSKAANTLTDSNRIHDFNQAIGQLQAAFDYFEKNGKFDSGERKTEVYRSAAAAADEKQDHGDDVKHARMIIARSGLRLLQQSIPAIREMADKCLELAGKDAVRTVCAPTLREGTDFQGQPYKPMPSEFTLPDGYEPLSLGKIASTVGVAAGVAVAQKIKTLIGM